jgi:hypothetical protein
MFCLVISEYQVFIKTDIKFTGVSGHPATLKTNTLNGVVRRKLLTHSINLECMPLQQGLQKQRYHLVGHQIQSLRELKESD